jgi:hypothetical protein
VPAVSPRPVVVLALLAVLVAAPACGPSNGGEVAPADYAKAVCSTLLTWKQGVANDSALLSQELRTTSADVATVKAKYTAFFQGVVGRTDVLLREIEMAGAPSVDRGPDYARDLRAALTGARAGLADARARFASLPASDLRSYATGAAKIRDQLGRVFVAVGAALDRLSRTYTDKGLNSAFDDESAYKTLA